MDELSFGYALVHHMLPSAIAATVAAGLWLWICRRIYREADREHQDTIRLPENYESLSFQQKWAEATSRRMVASRGSPSDRLFFLGLAAAGVFGAIWFGLWQIGLTPASTQERAYISTLRDSVFAQRPAVAAALTVADSSLYTSRHDFWQVQAAFDAVSSSNDDQAK